jgi:hypothetical protein
VGGRGLAGAGDRWLMFGCPGPATRIARRDRGLLLTARDTVGRSPAYGYEKFAVGLAVRVSVLVYAPATAVEGMARVRLAPTVLEPLP